MIIACIYHLNTVPFAYAAGLPFENNKTIQWLYVNGAIFVELFLVVSGFVTFMAYTDKIDNGLRFSQYVSKRIIRIFPLMIFCHFLTIPLYYLHQISFGNYWVDLGQNSIDMFLLDILGLNLVSPGLQTWNYPSWSLAIFFLCWLLYYAIIYCSRSMPNTRIWICLLIVLFGIAILSGNVMEITALFNGSAARGYISFFAGGCLYYLHTRLSQKQKNILVAAGLFLVFVASLLHILGFADGNPMILFGAFLFPISVFCILNIRCLNTLFSILPLRYLGSISFSVYLCNFPIYLTLAWLHGKGYVSIDFSSPAFFFGNIILHILVASAFCMIFEKLIPRRLKQLCSA